MTTITYGKSVKPVSKENAAMRRHQRRAAEAIDRKLVELRICKALGQQPEAVEVVAARKPSSRAELVTLTHFSKPVSNSDNCCLPEVARFAAGHRKTNNITAR
ncbi:antitermination protein [Serratia fonticola]|uniref:transcriptional antitermination N peptide n=1 Tax=Serratia fonticola TaxID=47917 RepID=UPI001646ADBF|nr:antitermination protein [Serratia fonticola]MBC3250482.1 antitermination protein [Serratia fonticola]